MMSLERKLGFQQRKSLTFEDSINYLAGWKVESISFEDQIFITLMKLRQNYTNLHLAQLFNCSVGTVANIITTFIYCCMTFSLMTL